MPLSNFGIVLFRISCDTNMQRLKKGSVKIIDLIEARVLVCLFVFAGQHIIQYLDITIYHKNSHANKRNWQ